MHKNQASVKTSFEAKAIRVLTDASGSPWFVGADICEALGISNSRDALSKLDPDEKGVGLTDTLGGQQEVGTVNESGLYTLILRCRDATKEGTVPHRFRKWVTAEVLPSLRKTGAYMVVPAAASAVQPSLEFKALYEVATLIGLDQNVAAISANQAVVKLTGTNVLNLLGHEHLIAADQSSLFYTPTELGQRIGVSGRKFNLLLAEAGLQAKHGDKWAPMTAAEGLYRVLDTGKKHGDGTMVQQVKWADRLLSLVDA